MDSEIILAIRERARAECRSNSCFDLKPKTAHKRPRRVIGATMIFRGIVTFCFRRNEVSRSRSHSPPRGITEINSVCERAGGRTPRHPSVTLKCSHVRRSENRNAFLSSRMALRFVLSSSKKDHKATSLSLTWRPSSESRSLNFLMFTRSAFCHKHQSQNTENLSLANRPNAARSVWCKPRQCFLPRVGFEIDPNRFRLGESEIRHRHARQPSRIIAPFLLLSPSKTTN